MERIHIAVPQGSILRPISVQYVYRRFVLHQGTSVSNLLAFHLVDTSCSSTLSESIKYFNRSLTITQSPSSHSHRRSKLFNYICVCFQTSGNQDDLVSAIRQDLDCVHNLVLYYQMETRSVLRAVMLQIFAALCTMSAVFVTTLLCSILTVELVTDFMSTEGTCSSQFY